MSNVFMDCCGFKVTIAESGPHKKWGVILESDQKDVPMPKRLGADRAIRLSSALMQATNEARRRNARRKASV